MVIAADNQVASLAPMPIAGTRLHRRPHVLFDGVGLSGLITVACGLVPTRPERER